MNAKKNKDLYHKAQPWASLVFIPWIMYWLLLTPSSFASVQSATDNLSFEINNDQHPEMVLNPIGLSIGTINPTSKLNVEGNAIFEALSIGDSPRSSSNLFLSGTFGQSISATSSNLSIQEEVHASLLLVDSSTSNIVIRLPVAGNITGRQYQVKKISKINDVNIYGGIDHKLGVKLINGHMGSLELISDGQQWRAISSINSQDITLSSNLKCYWDFDSMDSSIISSSNSYLPSGTFYTENALSVPSANTSLYGNAINLTGSAKNLRHISSSNLDQGGLHIGKNNSTLCFWMFVEQSTAQTFITKHSNGNSFGSGLYFDHDLKMIYFIKDSDSNANYHQTAVNAIPLNQWNHWAVSLDYNTSTVRFYQNGVLIRTHQGVSYTGHITNPDHKFMLGRDWSGHNSYILLDEFRMYDRLLSQGEIRQLAAQL